MKQSKIKIGSNRSFGIVIFVVFLIISIWPLLDEKELRYWSLIVSFIFLILGILKSNILTPLNKVWFKFGILLGNIISPIIMAFVFFLVVTPISLIMKIFGKDILNLKKNKNSSYWIKKDKQSGTMRKQFWMSFLTEFWEFLKHRKKYWLLPIIVFLVLFGGLIILSQGSAVAPFIYAIF